MYLLNLCKQYTSKRIHCWNPGLVRKARVHRTTSHWALLVQRNNNVVIWMIIPLFIFHFFGRVIVCVRYGINYAQKQCLGGKKNLHGFVAYSVTNRMRPSTEKKSHRYAEYCLFDFWRSLVTPRDARCDAPVIWWGRNLAIGFLHK